MSGGSVERVRLALLAAGHADTIEVFPDGTRSAAEAAAAVEGAMRLGVPPPKKMLASGRRPARSASRASSWRSAAAKAGWSMRSRTWLLKSQYGHLAAQKGQWM